jgi:hypothetical protein
MPIGMLMIAGSEVWATRVPVRGHFLGDLVGPWVVVGAGTAFRVHPDLGRRASGCQRSPIGLASSLLNTSNPTRRRHRHRDRLERRR